MSKPNLRLSVNAKPKARANKVTVIDPAEHSYIVETTQPPDKGKANESIRKLLADHLHIAQSRLTLISGQTSRTKIFELEGLE